MSARIINKVFTIPEAGLLILAAEFYFLGDTALAINTVISSVRDLYARKSKQSELSEPA